MISYWWIVPAFMSGGSLMFVAMAMFIVGSERPTEVRILTFPMKERGEK